MQMVVWGGEALPGLPTSVLGTGACYDPVTDTWTPTTQTGAPSARLEHTAVWTGSQMIVWGRRCQFRIIASRRFGDLLGRARPSRVRQLDIGERIRCSTRAARA